MSRRAISLATGAPDVLLRLDVTAGSMAQGRTVGEPADQLLREGDAVLVLTTHDSIDELIAEMQRVFDEHEAKIVKLFIAQAIIYAAVMGVATGIILAVLG